MKAECYFHHKKASNTKTKVASKLPGTRGDMNSYYSTALKKNYYQPDLFIRVWDNKFLYFSTLGMWYFI